MKCTITSKTENSLLNRTFVDGTFETGDITPSNSLIQKKVAEDLKVPEAQVVMRKITTEYGTKKGSFTAVAYKTEKDQAFFEVKTKHMREQEKKAAEAEKKAKEESAAAAETEKPEEKKEETPAEVKEEKEA